MAERARWDSKGEEGLLLRKLFSDHTADNSTGADPSLCDPKYIRSVWEKHDIFKKFAARNFLPTYKRLGKEWMIEQQKTGARQPNQNNKRERQEDSKEEAKQENLESDCEEEEDDDIEDDNTEDGNSNDISSDIEEIQEGLKAMAVAKLTFELPTLVYTWHDSNGNERCSIDMLLFSACTRDQLRVTVEKGGRKLKVEYLYPESFLATNRLNLQSSGNVTMNHSKATALAKAVRDLRASFKHDAVKSSFLVKLPIKCEEQPYDQDCEGVEVVMYCHHDELYAAEKQYYYMLHVQLISATKPFKAAAGVGGFRVVGSPLLAPAALAPTALSPNSSLAASSLSH